MLQLGFTHLLAAGVALIAYILLNSTITLSGWISLIVALLAAATVGLMATLNLQLGLQALELRLEQLITNLACPPLNQNEEKGLLAPLLARTATLSSRLVRVAQKG